MPATGGAAVTVEHLSKSYGDAVAVRDVSFDVQRGEVFALLGPNGAGKTTTVEILEGFRDRTSGRVETLGVDPADRSTQRWLRTRIGVVLQELAIEPYYSVRQVLTRNAGYYPNPRPVDEVIELIGLGEKADDRVKRLSGGQQRRLDVGLGIIGNPSLLFLDEPTTGLDPSGRRDTWQLIRLLAEGGTTVLLTTHYMDEVEALADRAAVLFGQEIVAIGTPSSIGGRDLGAVTIRFTLPEGVAPSALPVPAVRIEGDGDGAVVEIKTEDDVAVLHHLTGWAMGEGHPLRGLSVARVSLEDVYLGLTGEREDGALTIDSPVRGSFRGARDLPLVARQVGFEQLSFWLNPIGALMTIVFSVVFLVLLGATAGNSTVSFLSGIRLVQYYVGAFVGYGIMASCFNVLAITLVNRREMGLLKRLRLSPLPTWMLLAAIFVNSMIVACIQIVLLLVVGRLGYHVHGPVDVWSFLLLVVVGMLAFTAMGVGISTVVPNADAAGPIVSLTFFLLVALSGLWFPIRPGSGLATFSDYFPVRHLITGVVSAFNGVPGSSPWKDLAVIAVWGLAGTVVALRRWQWSPRRG